MRRSRCWSSGVSDVTTKEIAQAAGIAEGTIFRVFPDKATLLFAAAQEAINPAGGQEAFDAAMAEADDLRERIVARGDPRPGADAADDGS